MMKSKSRIGGFSSLRGIQEGQSYTRPSLIIVDDIMQDIKYYPAKLDMLQTHIMPQDFIDELHEILTSKGLKLNQATVDEEYKKWKFMQFVLKTPNISIGK